MDACGEAEMMAVTPLEPPTGGDARESGGMIRASDGLGEDYGGRVRQNDQ